MASSAPKRAALDKATGGRIKGVVERGDFSGRAGETLLLSEAGLKATRVVLVGLGAERSYSRKGWRRACTAALDDRRAHPHPQCGAGHRTAGRQGAG